MVVNRINLLLFLLEIMASFSRLFIILFSLCVTWVYFNIQFISYHMDMTTSVLSLSSNIIYRMDYDDSMCLLCHNNYINLDVRRHLYLDYIFHYIVGHVYFPSLRCAVFFPVYDCVHVQFFPF